MKSSLAESLSLIGSWVTLISVVTTVVELGVVAGLSDVVEKVGGRRGESVEGTSYN